MKKLITLILVLTGMVSTASADDPKTATVYVRAAVNPHLYAFEASTLGELNGGWPGNQMSAVSGHDGWYKADITYASAYKLIFSNNGTNQTADIGQLDSPIVYYNYDKDNATKASNHSVYQVDIRYELGDWNTSPLVLTPTANAFEWSGTMDLTETVANQNFKLVTSPDITGDLNWIGIGGATLTDEGSLVDVTTNVGDGKSYNYILKNSNKTYQTYTFTVQKTPSGTSPFAMTVAGKDSRTLATITGVYLWTGVSNVSLSKVGNTDSYTGSLDLSNFTSAKPFKLVVNEGGDSSDGWAGWIGKDNLAIDATSGWVSAAQDWTNGNLQINHASTAYATYNLTATWDSNNYYHKGWTLKIEGNDEKSYTVYYAGDFTTPKVYTYSPETAGGWSGTNMTPTDYTLNSKTVYSWSNTGQIPGKVIFTNNGSNQTGNLDFKNKSVYTGDNISGVAVTIGSTGFATFSSDQILDFTESAVKAYIASDITDGKVVLTKKTTVPASTGLFLKGAAGTYIIPVAASADAITTNKLVASVSDTEVLCSDKDSNGTYHYFLANGEHGVGFYNLASDTYSGTGKAYIETDTALTSGNAARVAWIFDDEATDIQQVENAKQNSESYFNLAGQRVALPTKGLYIVNGKKVVIK